MDRLEVDLAREQEVGVGELRVALERSSRARDGRSPRRSAAAGVRARRRRARRAASAARRSGSSSSARRSSTRCSALIFASVPTSSVPWPRWLCVASGTSSRMRSTSPSAKPASSRRSAAAPRTSPCAHGQALMPHASTPTTRRTRAGDAAAIPISVAISWVGRPVTGVRRSSGYWARICTSARRASCRRTMCARDVLGERLDEERLADHDLVDRLAEDLGKARHVNALLGRVEVDGAGDLRGERLLAPFVADPDRLLDSGHAGAGQADAHLGRRGLEVSDSWWFPVCVNPVEPYAMNDEPLRPSRFARLPRPAHPARDGLRVRADARARGGARRAESRFLAMISEASEQMTGMLDELGIAARIEGRPLGAGPGRGRHARSSRSRTTSGS